MTNKSPNLQVSRTLQVLPAIGIFGTNSPAAPTNYLENDSVHHPSSMPKRASKLKHSLLRLPEVQSRGRPLSEQGVQGIESSVLWTNQVRSQLPTPTFLLLSSFPLSLSRLEWPRPKRMLQAALAPGDQSWVGLMPRLMPRLMHARPPLYLTNARPGDI